MEEFEKIKQSTADIIKTNRGKMELMKNWKGEIRKCIITVRNDFIKWVDNITKQFILSLKDIEKSKELKEFSGIDRKLG